MTDYGTFMELTISHPVTNFRNWRVLPSMESEAWLRKRCLRLRFDNGRLIFWGKNSDILKAEKAALTGDRKRHDFYLFCSDPYFIRSGELPLYQPNKELLHFSIPQDQDALPGHGARVIAFDEKLRGEVQALRRKYQGEMLRFPPFGLLDLPEKDEGEASPLRLEIEARKVFWVYEIFPKPSCKISVKSASCIFNPLKDHGDSTLFISREPIAVSKKPLGGIGLVISDENGLELSLLENLPSPGLSQMDWDKDLKAYKGTVQVDLSRFGIVS